MSELIKNPNNPLVGNQSNQQIMIDAIAKW